MVAIRRRLAARLSAACCAAALAAGAGCGSSTSAGGEARQGPGRRSVATERPDAAPPDPLASPAPELGQAAGPTGPRSLAWGRLSARLPGEFREPPSHGAPPGERGEIAFQSCHYRGPEPSFELGVCTFPHLVASAELEAFARLDAAKRLEVRPGEVRLSKVATADANLEVLRLEAAVSVLCPVIGGADAAAVAYVGHPDGSVITVEVCLAPEDASLRQAALELADELFPSLGPGPSPHRRAKGWRKVYLHREDRFVRLPVDEGEGLFLHEGIDSWEYVVARPARAGEEPASLGFWIHNSPDPGSLQEGAPEFGTRRSAKLFGRSVPLLEKRVGPERWYLARERLVQADLFLSVRGRAGRALAASLRALEAAELRLAPWRCAAGGGEASDACSSDAPCGFHVVEPRPPLRVRASPASSAAEVGTLDWAARVEVAEQRGSWLRVSSPVEGWVAAELVRLQCGHEELED